MGCCWFSSSTVRAGHTTAWRESQWGPSLRWTGHTCPHTLAVAATVGTLERTTTEAIQSQTKVRWNTDMGLVSRMVEESGAEVVAIAGKRANGIPAPARALDVLDAIAEKLADDIPDPVQVSVAQSVARAIDVLDAIDSLDAVPATCVPDVPGASPANAMGQASGFAPETVPVGWCHVVGADGYSRARMGSLGCRSCSCERTWDTP